MNETLTLQGRAIGPHELGEVRQLIANHPEWTRFRISRELARQWTWRSDSGQLKDMAARTLLLKLEQRGLIELPARRWASPNRMRHKQVRALDNPIGQEPLEAPLAHLLPLDLQEVSSGAPTDRPLFEALLHQFHYLSYRSPVGENLQYLARERTGRPVACVLFGAAAWQCADRDQYIGWDATTRAARLHLIANNSRFLIAPWVQSPCLAGQVLGLVVRRIRADWQRKYGHPILSPRQRRHLKKINQAKNRERKVLSDRVLSEGAARAAKTAAALAVTGAHLTEGELQDWRRDMEQRLDEIQRQPERKAER